MTSQEASADFEDAVDVLRWNSGGESADDDANLGRGNRLRLDEQARKVGTGFDDPTKSSSLLHSLRSRQRQQR